MSAPALVVWRFGGWFLYGRSDEDLRNTTCAAQALRLDKQGPKLGPLLLGLHCRPVVAKNGLGWLHWSLGQTVGPIKLF